MFENQPKGLYALALANTGERFGYYTMLAVFALFLRENYGLDSGTAGLIYSSFLGLVYFLPLVGGALADKFGYGKMVTMGIIVMFLGYLLLSVPLGGDTIAMIAMLAALLFISFGTGLFKGNLQVMVGNLYDSPEYAAKRDSAFSIFYMAINIGALFAPTVAVKVKELAEKGFYVGDRFFQFSSNDAYHFSFAVACLSLVISMAIYYLCRSTFSHVEGGASKQNAQQKDASELSPAETSQRIVALILVFAVVIFFWMAFHQNGLTLTFFAKEFTAPQVYGIEQLPFNVFNLVAVIVIVYSGFAVVQSKSAMAKLIAGILIALSAAYIYYSYTQLGESLGIEAPIFQQFNPFYVVALTPVSMAIFASLARSGKEPSAPRKIAYGMLVAAVGFAVMLLGSFSLPTPEEQKALGDAGTFVSPNWLIGTYLVLTFGELLLSPMGISFVSKVAPPKYKGMMMGGWFVATALGNFLVSVGGLLWGSFPLWLVWSVFIVLCLLSALFMFAMMKRLEKVA